MKDTPHLEVTLKELNLGIPSFRMINCLIYGQIYSFASSSSPSNLGFINENLFNCTINAGFIFKQIAVY